MLFHDHPSNLVSQAILRISPEQLAAA
jgi:hypothetical protein